MFDTIKAWFKYSESIFLARAVVVIGFVTTTIGSLDLSPFWTLFTTGTEFSAKQLFWMGLGVVGAGVSFELARRRNDPYMTVQTAVAAEPEVAKAKKAVKKTLDKTPVAP